MIHINHYSRTTHLSVTMSHTKQTNNYLKNHEERSH